MEGGGWRVERYPPSTVYLYIQIGQVIPTCVLHIFICIIVFYIRLERRCK